MHQMFGLADGGGGRCSVCVALLDVLPRTGRNFSCTLHFRGHGPKSFLQNEKTNVHAPNAVLCSLHKVNYIFVESTKPTSPCVFQMSQTTEE